MMHRQQQERELVHMNPKEIQLLTQILGRREKNEDGSWDLSGLEHVFENPQVQEMMDDQMHQQEMQKFARGGHVQKMRDNGRHGDTEIASIHPNVARHFDRFNGQESRNPDTGHKEYFLPMLAAGLARLAPMAMNFLPKLGSFFGGAAKAAAPVAQAVGRGALAAGRGAMTAGRSALGAAKNVGNRIAANPYAQAAGRTAMQGARVAGKGLEVAGNVAGAAVPISMLYDRFGNKQEGPQAAPDQYQEEYQREFGRPQGGHGGRPGPSFRGDPNEETMDLSQPDYRPQNSNRGRPGGEYGGSPYRSGRMQAPEYGGSSYSSGYNGGQSSGYAPAPQRGSGMRNGMGTQPNYGQSQQQQGYGGRPGAYGMPPQRPAPQSEYGGFSEAINRYGPSAYAPGGPTNGGFPQRRPQMQRQPEYNPYM